MYDRLYYFLIVFFVAFTKLVLQVGHFGHQSIVFSFYRLRLRFHGFRIRLSCLSLCNIRTCYIILISRSTNRLKLRHGCIFDKNHNFLL